MGKYRGWLLGISVTDWSSPYVPETLPVRLRWIAFQITVSLALKESVLYPSIIALIINSEKATALPHNLSGVINGYSCFGQQRCSGFTKGAVLSNMPYPL